jgi:hypothetical protein
MASIMSLQTPLFIRPTLRKLNVSSPSPASQQNHLLAECFRKQLKVYLGFFHAVKRISDKIPNSQKLWSECMNHLCTVLRDPIDQGPKIKMDTPDPHVSPAHPDERFLQMEKEKKSFKQFKCLLVLIILLMLLSMVTRTVAHYVLHPCQMLVPTGKCAHCVSLHFG